MILYGNGSDPMLQLLRGGKRAKSLQVLPETEIIKVKKEYWKASCRMKRLIYGLARSLQYCKKLLDTSFK